MRFCCVRHDASMLEGLANNTKQGGDTLIDAVVRAMTGLISKS